MSSQETLREVPQAKVADIVKRYQMLGATVQSFPQTNGLVTIVATFPASGHNTPFATVNEAETIAPIMNGAEPQAQALSKSTDFAALANEYRAMYDTCTTLAAKRKEISARVEHIRTNETRYRSLGLTLKIPWIFIGVVHSMESNFDFGAHLHNGDPLSARTVRVPSGRPIQGFPPFTWEQSAQDAFEMKDFAGQNDWGIARTLYRLEVYNGFGYRRQGLPSPYLWSYSQHYKKGLFVADHVFDAQAVSKQPGAAVLVRALQDSFV